MTIEALNLLSFIENIMVLKKYQVKFRELNKINMLHILLVLKKYQYGKISFLKISYNNMVTFYIENLN